MRKDARMFPLKPRLPHKKLRLLFFLAISFLFINSIFLTPLILQGAESTMTKPELPNTKVASSTLAGINPSFHALARSPQAYQFFSQHDTAYPAVYCAPTVLAMAFSPFLTSQAVTSEALTHSASYVERFAQPLQTSPTQGTTVRQVLDAFTYFNTQDALAPEWNDVWYQGIHTVPAHYRQNPAQWARFNPELLHALEAGGVVMAHLGWYVEDAEEKRFLRKGGHYVLVTGVWESSEAVGHYFLEFMDPLDTPQAFYSRSPGYMLDFRPFNEEKKAFKAIDPQKQFRPRPVGTALFQPTAPPGKKDEVMTFLEGFVVLSKQFK
jgi:hypothetical protein